MLLINELSNRIGVSIHTIRYYENLGLIQGIKDETVRTNNYKRYDNNVIERLEIILEAKEVGFTLAEIRKLLESWYNPKSNSQEQIEMFKSKVQEIDIKVKQLKNIKKKLQEVIESLGSGNC
ncbi:MerR family transcriptional regulator [Sphingobacterium cellulitidis]|uniref:MerR family transcriptional regulator n=1 Tax=Sphingobacterium cellulitidis TaxID=1768011 RepID=UPI000B940252|nr:MerR family transcriptional regulator [Sphingobacterium cellulitidis]OYD45159.1 MerR family transcriptional regulator [Sphingobacterium cellulitidis]